MFGREKDVRVFGRSEASTQDKTNETELACKVQTWHDVATEIEIQGVFFSGIA